VGEEEGAGSRRVIVGEQRLRHRDTSEHAFSDADPGEWKVLEDMPAVCRARRRP